MAEDGKSLCTLLFADTAGILLKRDVEDPMYRVLDPPVLPHRLREPRVVCWQRGQKIARVDLDGFPHFTPCLHHPNAVQVGPGSLRPKPFNL